MKLATLSMYENGSTQIYVQKGNKTNIWWTAIKCSVLVFRVIDLYLKALVLDKSIFIDEKKDNLRE